jgi:hypothetical protein
MLDWTTGMRRGAGTLIGMASIGMEGKNFSSQVSPSGAGTVNQGSAGLIGDLTDPDRKRFFAKNGH